MDLKIIYINGKGDFDTEFVVLEAINDCNLKFSALADTSFLNEEYISNHLRNFFWLPDIEISAGDIVAVFTRPGNFTQKIENGRMVHRIYWGLNRAVWNNTGDAAILFSIKGWRSTGMI